MLSKIKLWLKHKKPCKCQLYKKFGDVKDSKYFKIKEDRKESIVFISHSIVSQCNKCNRVYLWSFTLHLNYDSYVFDSILDAFRKTREPIENMLEQSINKTKDWGYSEIMEK